MAFLGVFLVSIDRFFMRSSHLVRFEILVFLFLLAAILSQKIAQKKGKPGYLLISGFFAGLAILTHFTGILVIAVLFVFEILGYQFVPPFILLRIIPLSPATQTLLLSIQNTELRFFIVPEFCKNHPCCPCATDREKTKSISKSFFTSTKIN